MTDLTPSQRSLHPRSVLVAWLLAIGIDLFFNAGLFSGLFDQSREPGLLPDEVLFRRVPVAYLALAVGVAALAWVMDRTHLRGAWNGANLGAAFGAVASLLGVITLWTAIDLTGAFVAGGVLVQIVGSAAAGATLGAYRGTSSPGRVTRTALLIALLAAIGGVVLQNLL